MEGYRVPFQDAESEFTEKRSQFISNLWRVESEAEARAKIEGIRKARYDARHHCWCYLIQEGGTLTTGNLRAPPDSLCSTSFSGRA